MNKETKIGMLNARIQLLESRGPHNYKICQKIRRKIRQLQS